MSKEIVIQATKKETRIAIIEDGSLAELYIENPENARTIGDIHLGRVRNVMPSIQAAFVNIGQKQDAFLHFSDVGETLVDLFKMIGEECQVSDIDVHVPRVHRSIRASGEYESSPSRKKGNGKGEKGKGKGKKGNGKGEKGKGKGETGNGKGEKGNGKGKKGEYVHPARYLRNGKRILVQIVKEPISSKGSRVTSHVTLAGRFLVLVPFGDYVAVSKKIWSARERKRLQTVGRSLLPDGFGLIIRTVASGKDAKTLHTDMSLLVKKWDRILEKLGPKPSPPKSLHQDVSMVSSVIRDLFTDDYDRILIDDQRLFKSVQTYVRAVAPSMLPAIHRHDSDQPVYEAVGVDAALAEAFSSRVELQSGGYIIIEHTEAMHVIDVNSGRAGKGETQEENSLKVDLEAATKLAHQLRLRDLGGIIVVDFIDLRDEKNRNKVVNRLKQEFRKDRAVTKVLPMSDFGLIQITRQRLRPSITTDEAAREAEQALASEVRSGRAVSTQPTVETVDTVLKTLDKELAALRESGARGPVRLTVHPFFAAYLKKGIPNRVNRLRLKHRTKITLEENEAQDPTVYSLNALTNLAKKAQQAKASAGATGSAVKTDAQKLDSPESSEKGGSSQRSARPSGGNRRPPSRQSSKSSGRGRSGSPRPDRKKSGTKESEDSKQTATESESMQTNRNRGGRSQSSQGGRGQSSQGGRGQSSQGGRSQSSQSGRSQQSSQGGRGQNRGNRGGEQKRENKAGESPS